MDRPSKGTFRYVEREFAEVTWYKDPGLRKTYIVLMFVVLTSASNGFDGSMVNGLQSLEPWRVHFDFPEGSLLGLFSSIMAVGGIVALPITPYIADGWGRRWGIIIGCLIGLVGVALQGISINFRMFIAARFFIGFGTSIAQGASPLLITELAHPQHRAIFTTIYNTTWYVGAIIAAWATYGTNQINNNWSWRIPSLLQGFAPILQLVFVWFVPESPRFLFAKGKTERAHHVLAKTHANGDLNDELVMLEVQEIKETIALEKEFEGNGWLVFFKTVGNRRRLLILLTLGLFSQWSGNGIASYYLNIVLDDVGVTNDNTKLLINGGLQIMNMAVALGQCFIVDYVGRRTLFLVSTSGMFGTFCIWTACAATYTKSGVASAGHAVIAMVFIYYIFYNLAWSGLLVGYGCEILPYNLRAKGLTLMFLMVNVALFFNQYVNPIALRDIKWKYYIVYCVWLAIELAVVYFYYIETRYTPLEEIAKYFDGQDALVGGAVATEKGKILSAEMGGVDHDMDRKNPEVEHREL
ncbi:related to hexose transporter protein [Ramularia collo-cygni]|uniref:Related to hexose transporter protein n=1 Tax=Ramularia collo-cygni TaxID=112498 RepID=A0A2D3UVF3_9PEZI|nr:related to hexose transporter protein [Ramularia collo-cygni]CZT18155.1 related to hexose transporter protein [Ramularia collo-cygni]